MSARLDPEPVKVEPVDWSAAEAIHDVLKDEGFFVKRRVGEILARHRIAAQRDHLARPDARMVEALRQVGRKLMAIEDTVPIAKEAQAIILDAITATEAQGEGEG